MKTAFIIATGPIALFATGAAAQEGPNPLDPAHMDSQETAEAPEAELPAAPPESAAADFTDTQISSFVAAALAINDLDPDGTLAADEKREQAMAILADEGIDFETYSAIGQAARTNPEVAQRVREAMPNRAAASEG